MIDYKDLQESELNDTYTLVSKLYTPSTINIKIWIERLSLEKEHYLGR